MVDLQNLPSDVEVLLEVQLLEDPLVDVSAHDTLATSFGARRRGPGA